MAGCLYQAAAVWGRYLGENGAVGDDCLEQHSRRAEALEEGSVWGTLSRHYFTTSSVPRTGNHSFAPDAKPTTRWSLKLSTTVKVKPEPAK